MASSIIRIVDTVPSLDAFLTEISSPEVTKLAVDLEGVNLNRNGRISLIQILGNGTSATIWLIDVTTLKAEAFNHANATGKSLKSILESSNTTKIFYDVRTDSDALYNQYGIKLANVLDLQVLEVAVRRSNALKVKFVIGLAKAIEEHVKPSADWKLVKEAGGSLLFPELGGSYEAFERRPLDERVAQYAAQDVKLLFQLEVAMKGKIGAFDSNWMQRVLQASVMRVNEALGPAYIDGRSRAVAPMF